jgi:hypothetical protein
MTKAKNKIKNKVFFRDLGFIFRSMIHTFISRARYVFRTVPNNFAKIEIISVAFSGITW